MNTYTIEVVEPKALSLLRQLEQMNLIKFRSENKARKQFDTLLETCRKTGESNGDLLQLAQAADVSPFERIEIALQLYADSKWSSGQARRFSGLNIFDFQHLLKERNIYIHYTEEDLQDDLKTIEKMRLS